MNCAIKSMIVIMKIYSLNFQSWSNAQLQAENDLRIAIRAIEKLGHPFNKLEGSIKRRHEHESDSDSDINLGTMATNYIYIDNGNSHNTTIYMVLLKLF